MGFTALVALFFARVYGVLAAYYGLVTDFESTAHPPAAVEIFKLIWPPVAALAVYVLNIVDAVLASKTEANK